jgi:hypothetical protein
VDGTPDISQAKARESTIERRYDGAEQHGENADEGTGGDDGPRLRSAADGMRERVDRRAAVPGLPLEGISPDIQRRVHATTY